MIGLGRPLINYPHELGAVGSSRDGARQTLRAAKARHPSVLALKRVHNTNTLW